METRRAWLAKEATAAGEGWAERCRDELRKEGRRAAGGWPGTIREARARITAQVGPELVRRRMPALTGPELDEAARVAYAEAKHHWLARSEREAPEPKT